MIINAAHDVYMCIEEVFFGIPRADLRTQITNILDSCKHTKVISIMSVIKLIPNS